MAITIFHNPRCSKSRQALALLRDRGVEPEIVEYLKTPLSVEELTAILQKLDLEPREFIRRKEKEYKDLGLENPGLSREELIEAMVKNPRLIERPIVISEEGAVIGRPTEKILELI